MTQLNSWAFWYKSPNSDDRVYRATAKVPYRRFRHGNGGEITLPEEAAFEALMEQCGTDDTEILPGDHIVILFSDGHLGMFHLMQTAQPAGAGESIYVTATDKLPPPPKNVRF